MTSSRGRSRWARLALGAHPIRAVLEASLLGLLLIAGVLSIRSSLSPGMSLQGVLSAGAVAALWVALRARKQTSSRHLVRWGSETLLALGLCLLLGLGWVLADLSWDWTPALADSPLGRGTPLAVALGSALACFSLRLAIHAWSRWARLRRSHLIWAMTHMQVQIVLLFILLGLAVMLGAFILEGNLPPRTSEGGASAIADGLIATVVPLLGVMLLMAMGLLAVVLPPTVLFANLLSQRMTRRLDALAATASALSGGDFSARVEVQGEDEISQIQSDFNLMADSLEQAMNDLESERDRVADLLQSRRQLVASVSHELRTPVATVRGYLAVSYTHLTLPTN